MTDNQSESVWLKTDEEKLRSLIADEAKSLNIIDGMQSNLKQLRSKCIFRLALLNQLLENQQQS
jgi:hypothetical protein